MRNDWRVTEDIQVFSVACERIWGESSVKVYANVSEKNTLKSTKLMVLIRPPSFFELGKHSNISR